MFTGVSAAYKRERQASTPGPLGAEPVDVAPRRVHSERRETSFKLEPTRRGSADPLLPIPIARRNKFQFPAVISKFRSRSGSDSSEGMFLTRKVYFWMMFVHQRYFAPLHLIAFYGIITHWSLTFVFFHVGLILENFLFSFRLSSDCSSCSLGCFFRSCFLSSSLFLPHAWCVISCLGCCTDNRLNFYRLIDHSRRAKSIDVCGKCGASPS